MFIRLLNFLSYPPDSADGASGKMDKTDIENALALTDDESDDETIELDDKSDDKKVEAGKKDESETEDDDSDDDTDTQSLEDELEDELNPKGLDEDELELLAPVSRREILAKYPKIFKDFPALEKSYFREQKYTEILGTLSDAKEAKDKADTLDIFEKDLTDGNVEIILKSIQKMNPKSFDKVADDYMDVLARVDSKAFQHVAGNLVSNLVAAMAAAGKSGDNDVLVQAAQIVNQYFFGTSEYVGPKKLGKANSESDDKSEGIKKEREEWESQKFQSVKTDLDTRVTNIFKSNIDKFIDPKESLPAYAKKHASREAQEHLEKLIINDARFMKIVGGLWDKAKAANYSPEVMGVIKKAFLSKAQTLLPTVLKRARSEALKGMGIRKSSASENDDSDVADKKIIETRKLGQAKPNLGRIKSAKDIPAGMSSFEFMQQALGSK